ncbi:unnamed protein product [Calicophoron daubneyi]|uniref:Uncharacterized protein n=1 Tax=Calicophoron daubneyi TaxID=300641 RepID=A0AAV2T039_CALDB
MQQQQSSHSLELLNGTTLRPLTSEWISKYLMILEDFGQIILKHMYPNTYHLTVDDVFPVSNIWDLYLQQKIIAESAFAPGISETTSSPSQQDSHGNSSLPVCWDLYVVLHPLSGLFYITIPPPLTQTRTKEHLADLEDNNEDGEEVDVYEFVRCAWGPNAPKSCAHGKEYQISPHLTYLTVCHRLLPEVLDKITSSPNNQGLTVTDWQTEIYPEGADDGNSVQFKVYLRIDPAEGRGGDCDNRSDSCAHPGRAKSSASAASLHSRSRTEKHQQKATQAISERYGITPQNLELRLRFIPVYSINELKTKLIRPKRNRTLQTARCYYGNHRFLQAVPRPTLSGAQLALETPLWMACARIPDSYLLDKIDVSDKGCRLRAARIVQFLLQASDLFHHSKLAEIMPSRSTVQLALHCVHNDIEMSNKNQFAYFFHSASKPLTWQRYRLYNEVRSMLKNMHSALTEKHLPSFSGIESNILRTDSHITTHELKKAEGIIRSWIRSDGAFGQIIWYATKKLFENNSALLHLCSLEHSA